jgi:hypothetical protein
MADNQIQLPRVLLRSIVANEFSNPAFYEWSVDHFCQSLQYMFKSCAAFPDGRFDSATSLPLPLFL